MKPEHEIKYLEKSLKANESWVDKNTWKHFFYWALFFGVFMTVFMYFFEINGSDEQLNFLKALMMFLKYSLVGVVAHISSILVTKAVIRRQKKKISKLKESQ